ICWKIILPSRAPKALTASTYSSFLVVNVDPRTIRANCGKAPIAIAIVTLIVLPPRTDTIASAKRIPGKASKISMIRMITVSTYRVVYDKKYHVLSDLFQTNIGLMALITYQLG